VIFAFQERLCGLFEVEVAKDNGLQVQMFLTRLNGYLEMAEQVQQCSETKVKRKSGLPRAVSRKKSECAAPQSQLVSDVVAKFNVSVTELQFVFASVSKEANVNAEAEAPPRLLAAALVRADSSEDSD
jgi:hypothetical protein